MADQKPDVVILRELNHYPRAYSFMRNSLSWDDQFQEIFQELIILPMISFEVCVLCIWQYGHSSFALCLKVDYVTTWLWNDNKNLSKYSDNLFQDAPNQNNQIRIKTALIWTMVFINLFFLYVMILCYDQFDKLSL